MEQMTKEQAIAFAESGAWERLTPRERAVLQLTQRLMCMPFWAFHVALEEALGRPVWTHEIAFGLGEGGLLDELEGHRDAPSLDEVLALIPPEKLIAVVLP